MGINCELLLRMNPLILSPKEDDSVSSDSSCQSNPELREYFNRGDANCNVNPLTE
jgi:hypothetical protein